MQKYIITGGPSAGKTALLRELGSRGIYIIEEAAKNVIFKEQKNGMKEPWLKKDFQEKILDLQLKREGGIPSDKDIVVIDRGVPDGLAYYKHRNQEVPKELLESIAKCEYKKIFFLERLPDYEKTCFRAEEEEEAQRVSNLIKQTYKELGYEIIMVPSVSVKERAEFVLKNL